MTINEICHENRELIKDKTPENLAKIMANNQIIRDNVRRLNEAKINAAGLWLDGMRVIGYIVIALYISFGIYLILK